MIYGVGTDIVQIARIEAALGRQGERFAAKILGPDEMLVFRQRRDKVPARGVRFLAARFAAKEAFSKAIGLGLRAPMSWTAAQFGNDANGKPVLAAGGALLAFMNEHGLHAQVSISDEADYAVAFVVVEQDGGAR
jgi:holo-[acyl-carrier protein] synthase